MKRFVLAALLLAACQKSSPPPAGDPNGRAPQGLPGGGQGGDLGVHGQDMGGGNPHGGMGGGDPHAGMNMGGGDVHGGMGGGGDSMAPAPQDLDPSSVIEGTVEVSPALAGKVKSGDVIFLVAKLAGPDGQPSGQPLAVEKLVVPEGLPMPFTLSNQNQMIQGTNALKGNIVVAARLDRDEEASSKNPGDLEGFVPVTPPAQGVKLVLSTERQ